MHIAAIYFIQRQIAAQNRYNKRSYKKQVFTWRTISFLHEHLLFYLLFTGGINSGSQVFITDPTINPIVIYNNPVRHIAAIAAFPYDDTAHQREHIKNAHTGGYTSISLLLCFHCWVQPHPEQNRIKSFCRCPQWHDTVTYYNRKQGFMNTKSQ